MLDGKKCTDIDAKYDELISWHALTVEESIDKLGLAFDKFKDGISTLQVTERLEKFGPNKLSENKKETIWQKIWKQISNVLVCILILVAVVSAARAIVAMTENEGNTTVLTSWAQVGLITCVITVNTFIGILQEGSAEKAAEALKNMLSADARVIRNGTEVLIPSHNVVPGDIVVLSLGDRVPADMRMVEVSNLACQEAALTGESLPIDKTTDAILDPACVNPEQIPLGDRHNMCFSATLIAQGSGIGVVISTGDQTQIGTINTLVSQVERKKTNVLEQIDKVSKLLAVMIGLATLSTFFVALFKVKQSMFESVSTALVCCVAMIPEGLEAIVTLTYSWASTNMAKNNAIIRALPAVETLGSVSVICSDKTGTLTQNIMSLTAFVTSNARYRFDVNSSDRSPINFVRDDSFMAERAEHQLKKSASSVIREGGTNSGEKRKGRLATSNHFGIDSSLQSSDGGSGDGGYYFPKTADSSPYSNGESPSFDFVRTILTGGVLCSKCVLGTDGSRDGEIGNPTELSILRAAYFSGVDIDILKTDSPLVAEVPFSSEYKFMATINEVKDFDDKYVVHVKGAPDRMIKLCINQFKAGVIGDIEPFDESYWIEQIAILSSHGLRVLALCRATVDKMSVEAGANLGPDFVNNRDTKRWLTMVCLCAIMDPPRPECIRSIREAQGAGVRVVMITGDHKDTATAIGHMLGIVDEKYPTAIIGPELDVMNDEEIKVAIADHNVFARASPQNKIRIVKALQSQGQICSMTGDGVNDAPALKAADMGVAMGKEGTDVAREASDMILADDNFATIVTAIREGRVVWDNLRKVLLVNTPINNAQGMSVLFGLVFGLEDSPLSPIQVLYSNLICAITLGFVTAIEPAEDGIMKLPPRRVGKRLIGRYLLLRILIGTLTLTSLVVGSAFWLKGYNSDGCNPCKYDIKSIRSLAFNVLDFGAISVALSARFSYNSSFHPRLLRNNKYCWYSVGIVAVLQVFLTYVPGVNTSFFEMNTMDITMWIITFLCMLIMFVVMETEKAIRKYLKFKIGADTDDLQLNPTFDNMLEASENNTLLPKGASNLNLVSLEK